MASEAELEMKQKSPEQNTGTPNNNSVNSDLSELEIQIQKLKYLKNNVQVENMSTIVEYPAKDIVQKIISELYLKYDTTFLTDFYNVLLSDDTATIKEITNNIMLSIQQALKHRRSTGESFNEFETVTLAAWLSAATLWSAPHVPEAGRTFQTLLTMMSVQEMKCIAEMWWRAVPPDALLELAIVARAPPAPRGLFDMLLRGALAAGAGPPQWDAGALRPPELEAAADAAGAASLQLLRVAERVLAAEPSQSLLACLHAHAYKTTNIESCDQIQVSVTKCQILFGDGKIQKTERRGRKRKKDKSGGGDDNEHHAGRPRRKMYQQ